MPTFHGVPILKDSLIHELLDDFAVEFVMQPPTANLIISFQDKIDENLASIWIRDFAATKGLRLKLEPSFVGSFHVLKIIGEDADLIVANLLLLSPLLSKGHYATLSPFQEDIDLCQPKGLKQLIQVTFSSTLDWVEKGLPLISADIGTYLRHKKEKKVGSFFYPSLVKFKLDYFVLSMTLTVTQHLGGGIHCFDYIGLALHYFSCISILHANALCPKKHVVLKVLVPQLVAKDLFLPEASTIVEGPPAASL